MSYVITGDNTQYPKASCHTCPGKKTCRTKSKSEQRMWQWWLMYLSNFCCSVRMQQHFSSTSWRYILWSSIKRYWNLALYNIKPQNSLCYRWSETSVLVHLQVSLKTLFWVLSWVYGQVAQNQSFFLLISFLFRKININSLLFWEWDISSPIFFIIIATVTKTGYLQTANYIDAELCHPKCWVPSQGIGWGNVNFTYDIFRGGN